MDAKEFRSLLLLLKGDLEENNIPHRTTITKRVLELHQQQIERLSNQMLVSILYYIYYINYIKLILLKQTSMGKISFTMDVWTDLDMNAYMAVTAHWLQKASLQHSEGLQSKLALRSDLIGFVHISGSHTGERLAEVFDFILNRIKLGNSKKVHFV